MKNLICFGVAFVFSASAYAQNPRIVAHRGASYDAPENTLAAFNLAWEQQADGIEGDFYLSADGEVVCFHDKDLKRVAGRNETITSLSWSEISKLDVGSWKGDAFKGEKVPRLRDVLDTLPEGKIFFVEIKDGPRIVEPIKKILEEKKADKQQVVLISFNADVVRECRRLLPGYASHWISSLKDFDGEGKADAYLKDLEATGGSGLQFHWKAAVGGDWLKGLKEKNYRLTSWTVNDGDVARRMISYGVDHITTDRPAWLRAQLSLPVESWNVRDHVGRDEFLIQSHRGAGELGPENSKEAFELAWSLGTVPEADLRTTSDGVIVAFHDKDFQRILPGESEEMRKRGVESMTWEEVRKLDIGAWKGEAFKGQRIPDLKEIIGLLEADPKRKMYVDIKNIDLTQLAKEAAGVSERLILASTKPEIIREWKKVAPKSFTLHWMGGSEAALAKRLETLESENFKGVDQLQIHVKQVDGKLSPSEEFLASTGRKLRSYGVLFQTLPWSIRDEEVFTRLLDLGCASFATDFPDVTAKAVSDYYGRKRE